MLHHLILTRLLFKNLLANYKSNSSSKRKKKQGSPQPAAEENQETSDPPADTNLPDAFMDSSEEVDTQIASQLEQDLEFAVDMDGKPQNKRSDTFSQQSAARKRKRVEEEPPASTRNERRRSTRLTTGKDVDGVAEELDDSRSRDLLLLNRLNQSHLQLPLADLPGILSAKPREMLPQNLSLLLRNLLRSSQQKMQRPPGLLSGRANHSASRTRLPPLLWDWVFPTMSFPINTYARRGLGKLCLSLLHFLPKYRTTVKSRMVIRTWFLRALWLKTKL